MGVKKYIANSHISVVVATKQGGHVRISFNPITGGSSYYVTDDEAVQSALESHPKFGRLFRVDKYFVSLSEATQPKQKMVTSEETSSVREIEVACLDDAKEYLSEKYDVPRSKMMSRKAIEEIAKQHNIVFAFK